MKKIPTVFERDFANDNGRYVTHEPNPACEWVLDGMGVATRKLDGTCMLYGHDEVWYARREVKPGQAEPEGFTLVHHDPETGKKQGWLPAENNGFRAYLEEAISNYQQDFVPGATYELCGPKVNGNPENLAMHELLRHGQWVIGDVPRSYSGLQRYLADHPYMEGIVFYFPEVMPGAVMAKIKGKDFRRG